MVQLLWKMLWYSLVSMLYFTIEKKKKKKTTV